MKTRRTEKVEQITRPTSVPDDATLLGARDRAMLEVLSSTNLRISELVDLNVTDLDFARMAIRSGGNGTNQRTTPIAPRAIAAVRKYLDMRRTDVGTSVSDSSALFVNRHGQRLSTQSVRRKLAPYLPEWGRRPSITPTAYVVAVYENGVFRPLQSVPGLVDRTRVRIHVDTEPSSDADCAACIGTLPDDDAAEMLRVIHDEFDRVDLREWQ